MKARWVESTLRITLLIVKLTVTPLYVNTPAHFLYNIISCFRLVIHARKIFETTLYIKVKIIIKTHI